MICGHCGRETAPLNYHEGRADCEAAEVQPDMVKESVKAPRPRREVRANKAPFPWFGGKSKAAPLVWSLLGDVAHYVEPFFGSGAVLLERPHPCNRAYYSETVNDADGLLVNAWRAIQWRPEETAHHASWPVSEADKQARQIACLKWRTEKVLDLLAGSPEWCDPKMAGWWLYGVCCQIGAIRGPWTADPITGRIVKQPPARGTTRAYPYVSNDGMGVNHAGLREEGVFRARPHVSNDGMGVNHAGLREEGVLRARPDVSGGGMGVNRPQLREEGVGEDPEFHPHTMPGLIRWFEWLSARLRHVRIINGDWARVVTTGVALTLPVRQGKGSCGIFLDPPYDPKERNKNLYAEDSAGLAAAVRAWCLKTGSDPRYRIVLAGYDTEHVALEQHGWTVHEWFKHGFLAGGFGNVAKGRKTGDHQQKRERMWASPHCLHEAEASPEPSPGPLFCNVADAND